MTHPCSGPSSSSSPRSQAQPCPPSTGLLASPASCLPANAGRVVRLESRPVPGMRPEDVYELVNVSDPRISPDGRRVAYVVTRPDSEANDYRSAIWVAELDGSEEPPQ